MASAVRTFLKEISNETKAVKHTTHEFMYYMSIILLLLTNIVGIFLLIPLFIFLTGPELYITLIIISIFLGYLFNAFLHYIHHLGEKHHAIIAVLIPAMGLFDIVLVIRALDKINLLFNLHLNHNPVFIALLFIIVFLIPYTIDILREKHIVKF